MTVITVQINHVAHEITQETNSTGVEYSGDIQVASFIENVQDQSCTLVGSQSIPAHQAAKTLLIFSCLKINQNYNI